MNVMDRRVRGFRLVDIVGLALLMVIILGVYLAKTVAGRERAEIATIERDIRSEHERIRLLEAEVAHLEQPSRIERLSGEFLGMAPTTAKRETTPDRLALLAQSETAQ